MSYKKKDTVSYPAVPAAPLAVGDEVMCRGESGVITEVAVHDDHHFAAGQEQCYSVKVGGNTLGCVKESELSRP